MKAPILETIVVTKSVDEYPDLSWLEQCRTVRYGDLPESEEKERYIREDLQRLKNYGETWISLNIDATGYAELIHNNLTFTTELGDSISGVESDYEDGIKDYQNEFIYNILVECRKKKIKIAPNLKVIFKDKC